MDSSNRQLPIEAELAYLRGDTDGLVVFPQRLNHYAALIDGMIAVAKPQLKYLADFVRLGSFDRTGDPSDDWPGVQYDDGLHADEVSWRLALCPISPSLENLLAVSRYSCGATAP